MNLDFLIALLLISTDIPYPDEWTHHLPLNSAAKVLELDSHCGETLSDLRLRRVEYSDYPPCCYARLYSHYSRDWLRDQLHFGRIVRENLAIKAALWGVEFEGSDLAKELDRRWTLYDNVDDLLSDWRSSAYKRNLLRKLVRLSESGELPLSTLPPIVPLELLR